MIEMQTCAMRLVLLMTVSVGSTALADDFLSSVQFRTSRPLEYYDFRRVLATNAIRPEFKPVFPDALNAVSDFNPGTPVLGDSFANLTFQDPKATAQVTTRVLDSKGRELSKVVTVPISVDNDAKARVLYRVPRAGERLVLEAAVKAGDQTDLIRWPIQVPYPHRFYLDRNRRWEGDAPLGATLRFHLDEELIKQAKVTLRLVDSKSSKVLASATIEELQPDKHIIFCKLATQALKPGKYLVVAELNVGDRKSVSRQSLVVRKPPRPRVVRVPLRVEEVARLERESAMVSGGIPFADGTLRVEDADRVRVLDASGKMLPAQSRVLATWGPSCQWVRSLFVTTSVTTKPERTTELELQVGPDVETIPVAQPIGVQDISPTHERGKSKDNPSLARRASVIAHTDGRVVVDTGRLRFESRVGGGLFHQFWLDGKPMLRSPGKCRIMYIPRFSTQAGLLTSKGSGSATVDPIEPGLSAIALPPLLDFRPGMPQKGKEADWLKSGEGWYKFDTRGLVWARQQRIAGVDLADLKAGCYRATIDVSETLASIRETWLRAKAGSKDAITVWIDGKQLPEEYVVDGPHSLRIPLGGRLTPGAHQLAIMVRAGTTGRDASAGLSSPVSIRVPESLPTSTLAKLRAEARNVSETLWGRTTQIEIVEAGPLRAEICLRGFFGPDNEQAERVVRIVAQHGRPDLDVSVTWVNRRDTEQFVIGNLALVFPLRHGDEATIDVDAKPLNLKPGKHVWQHGSRSCLVFNRDGLRLNEGSRWSGWADAGGVMLALRKHWQNFPTGFELNGEGDALLHLWDGGGQRCLDISSSRAPERWNRRPTRLGIAKTYRLGLRLHGNQSRRLAPRDEDSARQLQQPLRLVADPKWVCDSLAFGPLYPFNPERFPHCERAFHDLFEGVELQQRIYNIYGAMDYGDFHSQWSRRNPADDANVPYRQGWDWYRYWLNNESTGSSTTIHLWMQYARTMQRRYFDLAADRTRHLMDVDTCHFSREMPARPVVEYSPVDVVGCQYNHDFYHWSGWPKVHHTKVDDLLLYYHLTGDGRALDVAREMHGMVKVLRLGRFGGGSIRVLSVPGSLAFHLYRQFWDPELLQYTRDSWETMRIHCGAGDRALITFGEFHRYTGDDRFLREWLSTSVVNENAPQPPMSKFIDGYIGPSLPAHARVHSVRATMAWFATRDHRAVMPLAKGFYSHRDEYAGASATYRVVTRGEYDLHGSGSLPKAIPNNGRDRQPAGYGWMSWGAMKYAYSLRALVDSGMIREEPTATVTAKGPRGEWSDPATWQGGTVPGADDDVEIPAGCVVFYDGPAKATRSCQAITIGGRLDFSAGQHTLVPAGDITVDKDAVFQMGPGSSLLFDCNFSGEFGLNVRGLIRFRGTSPKQRNCRVGPLCDDGLHNAYIHLFAQSGSGILENCELFRLGVGSAWAERPDRNPKLGIEFRGCATANFMRVTGNEIHHCPVGVFFYKSHGQDTHSEDERIADNEIHHCEVGLMCYGGLHHMTISGNHIHHNQTGMIHGGGCAEDVISGVITKNVFQQNEVALHITKNGAKSAHIRHNTYSDNDTAIILDTSSATLQNETINGGRIGIQLTDSGGGSLVKCRIGVEAPNTVANILAETEKGRLILRACTLGGPTKIVGNLKAVQIKP